MSSSIIMLRSSDDKEFEVDEVVAFESETIVNMIKDGSADIANILLPNITSNILSKVIEYCKKHTGGNVNQDDLKEFDAEFVKVDQDTLFDITLAANYLKIKKLLDLTCQAIADIIKGKSPEEIHKVFNLKNDFMEEEEERRTENKWAFE